MTAATTFDGQGATGRDHLWNVGSAPQRQLSDTSGEDGQALLDELMPRYRGIVSKTEVARALHAAMTDLQGSICAEALPEMATRLVIFRLDQNGDQAAANSWDIGDKVGRQDRESAPRG